MRILVYMQTANTEQQYNHLLLPLLFNVKPLSSGSIRKLIILSTSVPFAPLLSSPNTKHMDFSSAVTILRRRCQKFVMKQNMMQNKDKITDTA